MKYSVGNVVIYKETDMKFEIIEVTPISYKLLYVPLVEDNIQQSKHPEDYPHHFIEGEEFELSLKTLLKEL